MNFLSFGEIIFDVLETGAVLGGAPVNVAVHLARLRGESYIISAIGADELGKRAIEEISSNGVHTDFIGLSGYDTGRADVSLDSSGSACYTFNFPSAWDDINLFPQEFRRIKESAWDGFIFGTLAQRSDISKETLLSILNSIDAKEILFDVNLRGDFFSEDDLSLGFKRATILKLNIEELPVIAKLFRLSLDSFSSDIFNLYQNIKGILLTKGKDGMCYSTRESVFEKKAASLSVVDTIGAGDSVSAAFLYYLLKTGKPETALDYASLISEFVVSTKGALSEYSEELKDKLR